MTDKLEDVFVDTEDRATPGAPASAPGSSDVAALGDRAAHQALDALEDRVRYRRDADTQRSQAADLDHEADELRAQGNISEADARAREADAARAAADAAQAQADAQVVDETALGTLDGT